MPEQARRAQPRGRWAKQSASCTVGADERGTEIRRQNATQVATGLYRHTPPQPMSEITQSLVRIGSGDDSARDWLFVLRYQDLRKLEPRLAQVVEMRQSPASARIHRQRGAPNGPYGAIGTRPARCSSLH